MENTQIEKQENKKEFQQNFCVHIGTYDGSILGFAGTLKQLESRYAYGISAGSIKAITTSGRYLFVAGFDEIIRIYDTKKYKEVGNLDGHMGSILTMKSHKNILISSGDDGDIITWKFKEWSLLHRIKAHTTTIYDLCIHPSGKILISISKDNRLFVWNLMNGKKAYQKRFPYNLNRVTMLEEDKYICVLSDFNVHIINSQNNLELSLLKSERKVNDFICYKKYLVVGDEKGYITIWDAKLGEQDMEEEEENEEDIEKMIQQEEDEDEEQEEEDEEKKNAKALFNEKLAKKIEKNSQRATKIVFKAHSNRVKSMKIEQIDGIDFLVTVSSSGELKIWDFLEGILNQVESISENQDLESGVKPVYQIFTNQRITSMAVTVFNDEDEEEEEKKRIAQLKLKKESLKTPYIQSDKSNNNRKTVQNKKKEEEQEENEDPNGPRSILKKSKKIKKNKNNNNNKNNKNNDNSSNNKKTVKTQQPEQKKQNNNNKNIKNKGNNNNKKNNAQQKNNNANNNNKGKKPAMKKQNNKNKK